MKFKIKKDNYIGLGDKGLSSVGTDMITTLTDLINDLMFDDAELVTVYYGSDVTEEAANEAVSAISAKFADVEVELQYGGQPVYYYIVSVE